MNSDGHEKRLAEYLDGRCETASLDFKSEFNPNSNQDWCEVIKDIAAIANSGGGIIKLPHYFFEFDIYDKDAEQFLDLDRRLRMLEGIGLQTVPVVHRGSATVGELQSLVGPSTFDSAFDNPVTHTTDNLVEGLYCRTEADGRVTQSEHWQHQKMIPNLLADGSDIWA